MEVYLFKRVHFALKAFFALLTLITLSGGYLMAEVKVSESTIGKLEDGSLVRAYQLTNDKGMSVKLISYGAIIEELRVPDKNGKLVDVVLGYDNLEGYVKDTFFFGATIGRYANRIAKGEFKLDGKIYKIAKNDNNMNHLHGGNKGFNKRLWDSEVLKQGVKFTYVSKDGEEGYPGNLKSEVTYILTGDNRLEIDYKAVTDKPTVINLTNHSYFNLNGQGKGNILDHVMKIDGEFYTPVDNTLIPTGEILKVEGTPFDFTKPLAVGSRIDKVSPGYDHNYVLNKIQDELALAVEVYSPTTNILMKLYTTQPGVQFYTGNFLDGSMSGKSGTHYSKHTAFCLEPQHFPNTPNIGHFPSAVLKPNESYNQKIVYEFGIKK
jgi:aldose 1-epimerase